MRAVFNRPVFATRCWAKAYGVASVGKRRFFATEKTFVFFRGVKKRKYHEGKEEYEEKRGGELNEHSRTTKQRPGGSVVFANSCVFSRALFFVVPSFCGGSILRGSILGEAEIGSASVGAIGVDCWQWGSVIFVNL